MTSLDKEKLIDLRKEVGLFEHKEFTEEELAACREKLKLNESLDEPFVLSHDKKAILKTSENNLTREEVRELFDLTQIKLLKQIRNCLFFFVGLTLLSILLSLIALL